MEKAKIAIIGGTGLEFLIDASAKTRIGTPYGPSPPITIGKVAGKDVAFLPRHGEKHTVPPHKVNYQANIWALHALGVERILATNAVGGINPKFKPGDFVIPNDLIDFTKNRPTTFYDDAPVTHIDSTNIYCPELCHVLLAVAKKVKGKAWGDAVYLCTEGPRYETPAEIRMFHKFGCDVVGMTGVPEAVLARELEMCYAAICFVTNMAAGMQKRLTTEEVSKVADKSAEKMRQTIKDAIRKVPDKRKCECATSLEAARI
ncbi:MAG TPA: S-methyl-5'-thioadenosine phosphorylase [archaeon]|nr:S-methyl-5'-thioadenosine phosphorylase [archaeon]